LLCPTTPEPRPYERHRPETTPLYVVVREHLETFLAHVREERGKDLPRYVEQELRRYLRCGILAHGFCRVVCASCREEILVAYSCKCRGCCPSCSARRMCGTAANLVDHVLPHVPVRQWVLTVPHEVRHILALRPDALTAQNRIFVEEVARWQKRQAEARGIEGGETGSVTFVQRFNATLGSFVHLHVLVPDGVFVREGQAQALAFHEGPAPSREDIAAIAERVERRMTRWLRRRGLVDDRPAEDRSNEAREPSPLEACMQLSLFGGAYLRLAEDGTPVPLDDERFGPTGKSPWAAEVNGFNIHAGVTVRAGDREGLEKLCRYCARPPFSLERMSLLADGRIAYRLRKPRKNGATHLVLEPVQLLARIAALIPPPRFALTRFAGAFAPGSPWRADVVAYGRDATIPKPEPAKKKRPKKTASTQKGKGADSEPEREPRAPRTALGAGLVDAVGARIPWAELLRRIYLEDVLACPCGGRRRVIANIDDPAVVAAILVHLGLHTEAPPVARARSPTFGEA
jgi:Putative transposase/Transposase zinc-binding domain